MSGIEHCSPKAERGFTLVEVLVALVVTAFLVTILMDGAVTAKSRQANQELQRQAYALAQNRIDSLRDKNGPASTAQGQTPGLLWNLQETEIARDPRGAFVLVEANISAGSPEKPELVSLKKRYLKKLAR